MNCDVFIEVINPDFTCNGLKDASEKRFTQHTLWFLSVQWPEIHPFMPLVTKELWQRFPSSKELM